MPRRKKYQGREGRILRLREVLAREKDEGLGVFLSKMEPEDLAEILGEFSEEEKLRIFDLLDTDSAATVLDDTDPQTRLQILQRSDSRRLSQVLEEMPVDEAADIIEEAGKDQREDLLELLEKEEAEEVEAILGYPEDSAGRVMNPNFVSVKQEDDIETAISRIRNMALEEEFMYVYVVDNDMRLKGIVPLRKLLLSPRGTLISDIMEHEIHSVYVDTDQEQAAIVMRKYDLLSIPVMNRQQQLVGRITVDDIIDVIDEEQAEDISKMTGTIEEERGTETTVEAAKNRLPWLITCMLGSIVTGLVIQMYEVTLAEMIALVSFIPVITATGGNSGVQASTVVVRGLALGHLDITRLWEEVVRQLKIALSMGVICGVVLTVLANIWKKSSLVGVITGLSIFLVVVWSNFVGVFVPMFFKRVKIDPAIASGPLITTLNDVIGVFIYLTVATVFLS